MLLVHIGNIIRFFRNSLQFQYGRMKTSFDILQVSTKVHETTQELFTKYPDTTDEKECYNLQERTRV